MFSRSLDTLWYKEFNVVVFLVQDEMARWVACWPLHVNICLRLVWYHYNRRYNMSKNHARDIRWEHRWWDRMLLANKEEAILVVRANERIDWDRNDLRVGFAYRWPYYQWGEDAWFQVWSVTGMDEGIRGLQLRVRRGYSISLQYEWMRVWWQIRQRDWLGETEIPGIGY